ncbi:MAG: 7-carboxy-7-deazaguanine synthase [Proteobacteria bacterium]|nr:7-carboxy-7-deazaguanine synthase [Pseudomonadota bacterium]
MTYSVKEIFYTLQGEGAQAGRPAVFCRFTGCNLWSGLERDRQTATCNFCDTDFVGTDGEGGGKFATPAALVESIVACWPARLNTSAAPYVVFTGGEPLLQLDTRLIEALHEKGFEIAVETNGTLEAPPGIDWICVSPKATAPVTLSSGNELKLVYPQPSVMPDRFSHLQFDYYFLQPMDGPAVKENTQATIDYCKSNPQWRLSIQMHKLVGLP